MVPLPQQEEDVGLCSFEVELDKASWSPAIALTAQVSADVWHRRLGHLNPRKMELPRKADGNGVNYTGTVSGCDICALGKSQKKTHPKTSKHKTNRPMELVYTNHMGPITPAAKGVYTYISKFTDDFRE